MCRGQIQGDLPLPGCPVSPIYRACRAGLIIPMNINIGLLKHCPIIPRQQSCRSILSILAVNGNSAASLLLSPGVSISLHVGPIKLPVLTCDEAGLSPTCATGSIQANCCEETGGVGEPPPLKRPPPTFEAHHYSLAQRWNVLRGKTGLPANDHELLFDE